MYSDLDPKWAINKQIIEQAIAGRTAPSCMDRLTQLRDEYRQIKACLDFPFSLEERHQMYERRKAILAEARALASSLNIAGDHWFSGEE